MGTADATHAASVQRRAVHAVLNLVLREAVVRLLNVIVAALLARQLGPAPFGEYAIAAFAVGMFALVGDLGLGPALIRHGGDVTSGDLGAAFSLQVLWASVLALIAIASAPLVARVLGNQCPPDLIQVLTAAFLARSVRAIPLAFAERRLEYGKIAVAETAEQFVNAVAALALALSGHGVWSFVLAAVLGATTGTVVLLAQVGWRPVALRDPRRALRHLRFGATFQGQTIAHFVKDTIIPSVAGPAYGQTAVGYLTWAHQTAALPLVLTHLVSRVGFPTLAQLQGARDELVTTLEGMLRWTARVSLPAFAVCAGLAPEITRYIFGAQWLPALPALWWYSINMILGIATGILLPAMYAMGRTRAGLSISLLWAALTLAMSVGVVVAGAGFVSLAIVQAIGTAVALIAITVEIGRPRPLALAKSALLPLATGAALFVLLRLTATELSGRPFMLGVFAAVAAALAVAINVWPDRHNVWFFLLSWRMSVAAEAGVTAQPLSRPALTTGLSENRSAATNAGRA